MQQPSGTPTRQTLRLLSLCVAVAGGLGFLRAAGADDPLDEQRRAVRAIEREEKLAWEALPDRLREALEVRRKQYLEFHAGRQPDADHANDGLRALVEPLLTFERRRATAFGVLAASGAARSGQLLLDEAFGLVEEEELLDGELLDAHPVSHGMIYDQARAFRRQGLALREQGLLAALAKHPEVGVLLGAETWAAAEAGDGRRSAVRRVFVLDALGQTGAARLLPLLNPGLSDECACVRMAALEAAARMGPEAESLLGRALSDPHVLVRRAALGGLRALAPAQGRSLAAVVGRFAEACGAERTEAYATLRVLAGRDLGRDPAAWAAWLAEQREAIAAGNFDARAVTAQAPETVSAPAAEPRCFGVPLGSERVVFVVDWTLPMVAPVDIAFARTRTRLDWFGADASWVGRDGQERTQTVVRRELAGALAALPADARFGLVVLRDGNRDAWPRMQAESLIGRERLVPVTRATLAQVDRALGDVPPGWSRWHEQLDGLWHAADLAQVGPGLLTHLGTPAADTLVLVSSGELRGGRFLLPDAEAAAFARWNRFRRLVVHCVRVADEGRDTETLMQGLASASGGTYVHVTKAP